MKRVTFTTKEVAELIGLSKKTLLNWLKRGYIPEPLRNERNYREWTEHDVRHLLRFVNNYHKYETLRGRRKSGEGLNDRKPKRRRRKDDNLRQPRSGAGSKRTGAPH
ncbi:MAG: MerR family DNA-binding transcriptional regulator [bacterium JZ-2024 1]